jgi:hypothetical protein
VVVGVTPPTNGVLMAKQARDYFRNAQIMRVKMHLYGFHSSI